MPAVSYAMVRANDHGSAHALYDVVECVPGRVNRVLARNVFYHDAFDISFALNARINLGRE